LNGAGIHSPGARRKMRKGRAKDLWFAFLQVLFAQVQALRRHGIRTGAADVASSCQGRHTPDGRGIEQRTADTNMYWRARQYIE
jgi:hypothetical protein